MDTDSLFKKACLLQKDERKQFALALLDTLVDDEMDHHDRYDMLVLKAEAATCKTLTKSKNASNSIIRRFVATRLFYDGYGWSEIGRLMGRRHSSVISMFRKMNDMLELPMMYKKELEQYKIFNKLVDEFDAG